MLTQDEVRSHLSQFTQVDGWYHHWLNQFVFSDGVKWLCHHCECRWLLTDIAYFQLRLRRKYHHQLESFQIWHLKHLSSNLIVLECRVGIAQHPLVRDVQAIEFAIEEITLWLVGGMLLLPGEYSGYCNQSRSNP